MDVLIKYIEEMVFCFKKSMDWEKLLNIRGWRLRMCKCLRSLEQFYSHSESRGHNNFETEYFFNSYWNIETNNWDVETCRNKL